MSKVTNDVVKMDWDTKDWYQNAKGKFILASQTYNGVTVFFDGTVAFVFKDDEGCYTMDDMKGFIKESRPSMEEFPEEYEETYIVAEIGGTSCYSDVVKQFGLDDYQADILQRVNDLSGYTVETFKNLG